MIGGAPGWLVGAAAALLLALVLGAAPQPLLAEVAGRKQSWRSVAALVTAIAVAGLAAVAAATVLGEQNQAWRIAALATCLTAVMVVDARHLVIPDLYVLALCALAIVWAGSLDWRQAALGAGLGGGLLGAVRVLYRQVRGAEGLGLGDVKLMAALGAMAGAERVLWIIACGAGIGAAWLLVRARVSNQSNSAAPFGACVAGPAFLILAAGRLAL